VEFIQPDSVPSAKGEEVAATQLVHESEAVLLDQCDDAPQAAVIR
jgi:hypothetical protein